MIKLPTLWLIIIVSFGLIGCSSDDGETTEVPDPNAPNRYNAEVFDDFDLTRNIRYGQNTTQGGAGQELRLDFYEPSGDTAVSRPLLVYAFGGGFVIGDKQEALVYAPFFARSGYAFAAIDYRLIDIEDTPVSRTRAVYDAASDMKAAVRFLKQNYATYNIDTTNIFVGGFSAGAFTALQYAYLNDIEDIASISPTLLAYVEERGGIPGNSGNPGISTTVKGVFNFAGAMLDANYIDPDEPILFSIHGTNDDVVPFNIGEADASGVTTEGSNLLHEQADAIGLINQLVIVEGGSHVAPLNCQDCLIEMREFIFSHL
ncbi:MAG: alpha/beta hydrolase [Bacteroidota bacterium]